MWSNGFLHMWNNVFCTCGIMGLLQVWNNGFIAHVKSNFFDLRHCGLISYIPRAMELVMIQAHLSRNRFIFINFNLPCLFVISCHKVAWSWILGGAITQSQVQSHQRSGKCWYDFSCNLNNNCVVRPRRLKVDYHLLRLFPALVGGVAFPLTNIVKTLRYTPLKLAS